MSITPSSTWSQFYFELHRSAERLRELMARLEASVALLDTDDAEFNKPFSAACELDASLRGLPSAKPEVKQTEAQL